MAEDPQLAQLTREMGRVAGRLEEIDHRVDRAMQRIDASEQAAVVAKERADRAEKLALENVPSGGMARAMARLEKAEERVRRVEQMVRVPGEAGDGGLTKPERIALMTGAPLVIAAVIAALVEILKIIGAT